MSPKSIIRSSVTPASYSSGQTVSAQHFLPGCTDDQSCYCSGPRAPHRIQGSEKTHTHTHSSIKTKIKLRSEGCLQIFKSIAQIQDQDFIFYICISDVTFFQKDRRYESSNRSPLGFADAWLCVKFVICQRGCVRLGRAKTR